MPFYTRPKMLAFDPIPRTSQARLDASLPDAPLDIATLLAHPPTPTSEKPKTVLYLAYGSNLCNETFRGARGIRPLSQVNVVVPSLRLTFDLPGVPYKEPCFANTARRIPSAQEHHKDAWHKGLVGVVYEVTLSDYAHIIATEGGGSAYADILVDCHVLDKGKDTVPTTPTSKPFKAHTLFASQEDNERIVRPDPSYAQPSARYLKLIRDGALECELPGEYREYLHGIRPFRITRKKQAVGQALFLSIWMPFVLFVFALGKKFSDEKGRAPAWLAKLTAMVFSGMWTSYDAVFKPVFGEGERTVGDEALGAMDQSIWEALSTRQDAEKEGLLEESVHTMYTAQMAVQRPSRGDDVESC